MKKGDLYVSVLEDRTTLVIYKVHKERADVYLSSRDYDIVSAHKDVINNRFKKVGKLNFIRMYLMKLGVLTISI